MGWVASRLAGTVEPWRINASQSTCFSLDLLPRRLLILFRIVRLRQKVKPMLASCPECQTEMRMNDGVRLNEIVVCDDCASELEVVTVEPVILALAPEAEEDWGE